MKKGRKIRAIAIITLVALLATTEYKTLYEVAVASSFMGVENDAAASGKSGETAVTEQTEAEAVTGETSIAEQTEVEPETTEASTVSENDTDSNETEDDDSEAEDSDIKTENDDAEAEDDETEAEAEETDASMAEDITNDTVSENELAEELSIENASEIPTTLDEFNTWYATQTDGKVHITTVDDWLAIQELSQLTSLEGCVFQIDANTSGNSNIYELSSSFKGIGCEEYPFKGTLTCYLSSGVSIQTYAPIFQYLSAGSSVSKLSIIANKATAGLAANVVGSGTVSLSNITINGSVKNTDGAAGGLFGQIANTDAEALTISVEKENNTGVLFSVYSDTKVVVEGNYCGAIAGSVSGNVEFVYDTNLYDLSQFGYVSGLSAAGASGLLFGKVEGDTTYQPKIVLKNTTDGADTIEISNINQVFSGGNAGGLIGQMNYGILDASDKKVVVTGGSSASTADVSCSFCNANTTGIGGLIGVLENSTIVKNSKFELKNTYIYATVNLKAIGGFFGIVIDSDIQQCDDGGTMFTLTNVYAHGTSSSACNALGGICGYYQDDTRKNNIFSNIIVQNSKVNIQNHTTGKKSANGMIIGMFNGNNQSTLTLSDINIHGFMATGNMGSGTGGIIGVSTGDGTGVLTVKDSIVDTSPNDNASNTHMTNKGYSYIIWETYSPVGGVLGVLEAGNCYIESISMPELTMRSDRECGSVVGKIEGSDSKKYLSIENIELGTLYWSDDSAAESSSNGYGTKGLLIGKAGKNTIVRLAGKMDFSNVIWYWTNPQYSYPAIGYKSYYDLTQYVGKIAGIQEKAVIYMEADCNYTPYEFVPLNDSHDKLKVKYVDDIGNFGGVFKNGTWGGTEKVFDGDTIKGSIAKPGDSYQLATVGDLMRFAIVMNSEGAFGTDCFGGTDYTTLLSASYVLTGTKYDLSTTGIVSLQRTAGKGTSASITSLTIPTQLTETPELFKGSFSGSSADTPAEIILTRDVYRQNNQGLFANVGSEKSEENPAVFANLKLTENFTQLESIITKNNYTNNSIDETGSMGGLSVYAQGNITVENCELEVNMESRKYVATTSKKAYYGGLFGRYSALIGSTLTVNKVTAKGTKTARDNDHYVSQFIASVVSPYNAGTLPVINLSNITISGSVANTNEYDNSYDTDTYSYLGGLITVMNENLEDGSRELSWESGDESWHYFKTERTEINIDGLKVSGFSLKNSSAAKRSSGLLGFRWLDVNATLKNVTIGDEAGNPNTLTTYMRFGGLLNEVCGRMDVQQATICNTDITSYDTTNSCAILVAEGNYLYLSVTDYDVQDSTTIERSANKTFDEIVGCSKQRGSKGSDDYAYSGSTGGVVSISTTDVDKSLLISAYNSYKNGATYTIGDEPLEAKEVTDIAVRYYYDIPTIMSDDNAGNLADTIISTPQELMRWHLLQYSRSNLKKYFATTAEREAGSSLITGDFTISGDIDLDGYSYYPTSIDHRTIKGDNATITFHGQEIIDAETADTLRQRQPYDYKKPQYMLHSALFKDVAAVNISGLTLSGTVSEIKNHCSGALVCGEIEGVEVTEGDEDDKLGYLYSTKSENYTNIFDITLDNLWVAKETKESWNGTKCGLMIASITNGAKVTFDSIRMSGYDVEKSKPTRETKAARALIAVVGEQSETSVTEEDSEIQLSFTNMDIADVADDTDLTDTSSCPDLKNSTENDKVLKNASFICYYNYYEDSCYGIYTFTKADYLSGKEIDWDANDSDYAKADTYDSLGYITMGLEIDSDTEYIDENISTKILQDIYGFENTNYKPYVYETRTIIVNPKPGHITEGCGTYEDPYVIENDKQLKSVYYYLKNQTAQLINWQVNPTGTDATFCAGSHTEDELKTYGKDTEGFPTREQMSQAYYLIKPAADTDGNRVIDLTGCDDFVGFGSLNEPFVGVIVGDTAAGSQPVIKLPGYVNTDQDIDSFGLVRYAKGCVVKDLTIELGTTKTESSGDTDTDVTYYAGIKGAGAGVFGNVCGGDNVIDNVTVKGTLQAADVAEGSTYSTAQIGGYVGCVDLGTVILRNINADSLKNFSVTNSANASVKDNGSYIWIGGIIGRVKDGAVVYEGATDTTSPVVKTGTAGFNYTNTQGLEVSKNYGILNDTYFKDETSCGKVDIDTTSTAITIEADNPGQLMLLAATLNSGCFTYVGDTESELQYRNGYGADSRCRNGNYSNVGTVTSASDSDYVDIVTYDNLNGKQPTTADFYSPYLFKYFNPSGVSLQTVLLGTSDTLAYNDPALVSEYIVMDANSLTLKLASDTSYDMTDFNGSFRGIGGGYFKENNTFKGNVEGNNSAVELSYISNVSLGIDDIGLFNTVVIDAQSDGCYMENLTITGKLLNAEVVSDITTLTDDLLDGDSISGKSAAGLIGRLEIESDLAAANYAAKYNYSFTNINVNNINVESQEYAGGIIGRIECTPKGGQNSTYANALYFENCAVGEENESEAEDEYNVIIKGRADVGGFIASYQDAMNVTFVNCSAKSVDLQARGMHLFQVKSGSTEDTYLERKVYASAGGFIGRGVGKDKTITVTGGSYNKISLKAKGNMGGVIGETESTLLVNGDETTDSFSGNEISFSGLGTVSETYIKSESQIDATATSSGTYNTYEASYNRTGYIGSFGGFAGFVSGPGTQLYHITITNVNGTIPTGRKDETFIGGLVGRLYETGTTACTIKGCTVGSETTDLSMIASGDSQRKYMTSDRVSVGGLAGNIESSAITYITDCSVIGNGDGSSTLQGTDSAGGLNGIVKTYASDGKNIYYESCTVKNLAINAFVRAGGAEGSRVYQLPGNTSIDAFSRFHNVTVSDCVLYNMDEISVSSEDSNYVVSGGLQAYSTAHAIVVSCMVENVQMKGNTTYAAGGLLGRGTGNYAWIRAADTTVKDCTIVGACVGGIAGRIDKSASGGGMTCFSEVTVTHNKILSHYHTDAVQYVGGLYGYWSTTYGYTMGEDIEISDNLIAALPTSFANCSGNVFVGGMMGLVCNETKIKSPYMKNNIVTMIDKEELLEVIETKKSSNEVTADVTLEDYLINDSFGIWNNDGDVDADAVDSVQVRMYNSTGNNYELYHELTTEDENKNYLAYVGLLFGSKGAKAVWVTDVKVSYDEELRVYRPAADVSRNLTSSWDYHIVYGEYEDSEYKNGQTDVDNKNIATAVGLGDAYYQFGDLQKIWSDYKAQTDKKYAYRLATNYQGTGFKTSFTIEEILSGTYYDETEGYRSIYTNADGVVIPMLVYDNNASLDEMINTALNVLTNNGGCLRETNGRYLRSVTPIKMVIEEGVVRQATEDDKEDYSIEPSIQTSNASFTSIACNVNSTGYDEQKDSKNGTFTVLKIDFSWSYGSGNNSLTYTSDWKKYEGDAAPTMTLYIPVYVEKVLEYQTHITGLQGAEYYLDNLLENGKSSIQTLRDTYTAYVEYDYNDAYQKYNSAMNKEISYKHTGTGADVNIPKGTKFVLIDITDNGHAYYYKVPSDTTSVSLSAFTDSNNVQYVESNVSALAQSSTDKTLYIKHENTDTDNLSMPSEYYAIQKYILLVDSSEVTDAVDNYSYKLTIQPDTDNTETATLVRRAINKACEQNCELSIIEYQGISGEFNEENTSITGEISPEENVTINLEYDVTAPGEYWTYLTANQGSNISQYLDVAIYLQKDGNRVALPSGTQVIFNKGTENQAVGVMQGNTILYQYKDAGLTYDLNTLTGDITISGTIDLDFGGADFTDFDNGEYTVIFELLKTKDANFPTGGIVLDTFTTTVNSTAEKNLGFVLETTDLLALGMNGYLPEESDSGVIDCTMKIDFSDFLTTLGAASKEMTELSNKYFTVQFEIQKKVKDDDGNLTYETYDGDLVQIYFGESETALEDKTAGSKVVYKFTEDFMKKGNSQEKSVVAFPYTVVADVDGLLEDYDNITNYRVIAKLYLTDNLPSGSKDAAETDSPEGCEIRISPQVSMSSGAESMKDYFVFTVAKIKTDLDITQ